MKNKIKVGFFSTLIILSLFTILPTVSSKKPKIVQIGVISASTAGLETTEPFFNKILQKEITKCARALSTY